MKTIQLENNVVLLRPMNWEDVEAIAAVAIDHRIWEHISYTLETKEDVEIYVKEQLQLAEKQGRLIFVIIDKVTNRIIGSTSIYDLSLEHARCEIGSTWLAPSYWRTSINTNCKYLLFHYVFEELQFERVQLKTDNKNTRSQQAIERLGAKFEGRLRRHMRRKDGTMRDTMLYSIIREEWPTIKQNLEALLEQYEDR